MRVCVRARSRVFTRLERDGKRGWEWVVEKERKRWGELGEKIERRVHALLARIVVVIVVVIVVEKRAFLSRVNRPCAQKFVSIVYIYIYIYLSRARVVVVIVVERAPKDKKEKDEERKVVGKKRE